MTHSRFKTCFILIGSLGCLKEVIATDRLLGNNLPVLNFNGAHGNNPHMSDICGLFPYALFLRQIT